MLVPHLCLPLSDAKKVAREAISRLGGQPLFSLDMGYPQFADLLDYLADDLHAAMVNLRYRKRRDVSQHYLHLESLAGRDVAFLMTGVARMDNDHGNLSTMHYMPFLGSDLFAVEAPLPVISAARERRAVSAPRAGRPRNISNLKALHRDELTILKITDPRMSERAVLDLGGNPVSEDLRITVDNVKEAERDPKKYSIINAVTRIQELLGSTAEFRKMASHIKERSSRDYVRGKKDLEARLRDV